MRVRPFSTLPLRLSLKLRLVRARLERWAQRRRLVRLRGVTDEPVPTSRRADILAIVIHPYALVGHQVSAWMAGILWAKDLKLEPRSSALTRDDGGFYAISGTPIARREPGYVSVRLPSVEDERTGDSVAILKRRIESARKKHGTRAIRFELALDQPRWDLTKASAELRASIRAGSHAGNLLAAEGAAPYIAIHIRRPASKGEITPEAHPDRWLTTEWYARLINRIRSVPELEQLPIRVYSLGDRADFELLAHLRGVTLWLNGDRDEDFCGLIAARLLVIAPSSFSYNAAIASHGAVLGRVPWWHEIPNRGRWAHMNLNGDFDLVDLQRAMDSSPTPADGR